MFISSVTPFLLKRTDNPDVVGGEIEPYYTVLFVSADGQVAALCTCPYDREWCEHVVATILHAIEPVPAVRKHVKNRRLHLRLDRPSSQRGEPVGDRVLAAALAALGNAPCLGSIQRRLGWS